MQQSLALQTPCTQMKGHGALVAQAQLRKFAHVSGPRASPPSLPAEPQCAWPPSGAAVSLRTELHVGALTQHAPLGSGSFHATERPCDIY